MADRCPTCPNMKDKEEARCVMCEWAWGPSSTSEEGETDG